ncbi:beta-1,3-glucosyltransferase [Vibrio maritimus]|uniref:Beta-1,3-glucosyltransferase n=1 Tax=Vibrio maritimus TaxID=990268 RepID=A0A090S1H3_9VIBR|nr:beta-1,3-glucosyltransferase [Vibrio maritimus]
MTSNTNPTVSIVIPNFNCLAYLPQCLQSIAQQTYTDYEILFVDDGSTDGSREYLTELSNTHSHISLILSERGGPGAARNLGVAQARGEWIAFLDADDLWTHSKLAEQVGFMRNHPDCVLSFTNYEHINESNEFIIPCFQYWPEFQRYIESQSESIDYQLLTNATAMLFKENIVGTSSVMCRRDAYLQVQGFDCELPSASDWDLWLKLSEAGGVAFTNEIRMHYLMRQGSVSSNVPKRIEAMKTIAQRHVSFAQAQCSKAQRFVDERLMDAYCEYATQNKGYFYRTAKHVQTFITY